MSAETAGALSPSRFTQALPKVAGKTDLQLYLSGRCGGPFLTALAQRISYGDQLSGHGGDDDLVRFSGLAEAICEGSQAWVMMCRDQRRLDHHQPQGTTTIGDGPFPAKCSAVMRDRGQSGECRCLFASDGADLGHFGDRIALAVGQIPGMERRTMAICDR